MPPTPGNLLGAPRAEADTTMLEKAFVKTKDFLALSETDDFNFIVGRRGTGKSALFAKLAEKISSRGDTVLIQTAPEEHHAAELNGLLVRYATDYIGVRRIAKLLWKAELLLSVISHKCTHYKKAKLSCEFLDTYLQDVERCIGPIGSPSRVSILRRYEGENLPTALLPSRIAADYKLDRAETVLSELLIKHHLRAVVMCDRLDEGWLPDAVSTGSLGGLANAAASFIDRKSPIQVLLFIRDNMFRALSHMDSDFSRNIEGSTLRLSWNKESLFHLVAERLRVALCLPSTENDTKVWNRFAQRELRERDGFNVCLQNTLYRPRDILVLLNAAYRFAGQDARDAIVPSDIESSARQVSNERLNDLLKEYDTVLPGLRLLTDVFKGRPARAAYGDVLSLLQATLESCTYSERISSDFALLDNPSVMFDALYGVGFLGILDPTSGSYQFCHDGAPASPERAPSSATVIHPCYWKALACPEATLDESVAIEINDEYTPGETTIGDFRNKRLGTVVSDLNAIPMGHDGQGEFERWAFRALKLLFAGSLANIQMKPNGGDAVQRRDVVATISASSGFWKRILDDYKSRQIVFEMKNYAAIGAEECRQLASYLAGEYGNFGVIVTRSTSEGLSSVERNWVKETYDTQQKMVLLVPAMMISRAVQKIRSPKRFDYADDMLSKRMDVFVRSYLSLRHHNRKR
jgi:hypothetical protein